MSNILVVGKYYPPFVGGIEDNTGNIAKALVRRGHTVTALVNAHQGSTDSVEELDGVKVIRRQPWATLSNQPMALNLFKGVRLSDFDLIHFHAPNPFASLLLLFLLGRAKRKPALAITHHMDIKGRPGLRELSRVVYARLVAMAGLVIVTSMKNARVSQDLPPSEIVAAVPLGVDPQRYVVSDKMKSDALEWRKQISGDAPLVGFLGRHARYKGLEILVRSAEALTGVHFAIAGNGPYRRMAEALAEELGVSSRVHFLGEVDHATKLKLMSSIDVYAFPSTEVTEAFGISQLEAMLCGAPVVASALPTGVTDVSVDGETALTCMPGKVEDLVEKIQTLLDNRILACRLSVAARKRVLESMTSDVIEERTCRYIEDIILG